MVLSQRDLVRGGNLMSLKDVVTLDISLQVRGGATTRYLRRTQATFRSDREPRE